MKISGVYLITNKINKKHYVGESKNVMYRLRKHKERLVAKSHENVYLQNAVNKHGIENFEFSLLEEYPEELTKAMECYWMNLTDSCNRRYGYNIQLGNPKTKSVSVETRQKMSVSTTEGFKTGLRKISDRHKDINSKRCKNVPLSEEHKRKIAESHQKIIHPNCKLDPEKVKIIREKLAVGQSALSISKDFKVSQATILNIKSGKTWKTK